jgi:hypothetical protein
MLSSVWYVHSVAEFNELAPFLRSPMSKQIYVFMQRPAWKQRWNGLARYLVSPVVDIPKFEVSRFGKSEPTQM